MKYTVGIWYGPFCYLEIYSHVQREFDIAWYVRDASDVFCYFEICLVRTNTQWLVIFIMLNSWFFVEHFRSISFGIFIINSVSVCDIKYVICIVLGCRRMMTSCHGTAFFNTSTLWDEYFNESSSWSFVRKIKDSTADSHYKGSVIWCFGLSFLVSLKKCVGQTMALSFFETPWRPCPLTVTGVH